MPGYHDIDGSPSKSFMMENSKAYPVLFSNAFSKRNGAQLYDIKNDPGCMNDLSGDPEYFDTKDKLRIILDEQLANQGDPRMSGSEVFDSYPRYSPMRNFEGFNKRGEYNPDYQ